PSLALLRAVGGNARVRIRARRRDDCRRCRARAACACRCLDTVGRPVDGSVRCRPDPRRRLRRPGGTLALLARGATREVMLILAATFVMVGAFDVLAVALAVGVLDLGGSGAGYINALHGSGAALGADLSFTLLSGARIMPVLLAVALAGARLALVGTG